MTLDDFLQRADADVQAYAAAMRTAQAEGVEGLDPAVKSREDWWREVAVYYDHSAFMETVGQ